MRLLFAVLLVIGVTFPISCTEAQEITMKDPTADQVMELGFEPNPFLTFYNGDTKIGQLDWADEKVSFDGDVEASAQLFFEFLMHRFLECNCKERGTNVN